MLVARGGAFDFLIVDLDARRSGVNI